MHTEPGASSSLNECNDPQNLPAHFSQRSASISALSSHFLPRIDLRENLQGTPTPTGDDGAGNTGFPVSSYKHPQINPVTLGKDIQITTSKGATRGTSIEVQVLEKAQLPLPSKIFTSPMTRAVETANFAAWTCRNCSDFGCRNHKKTGQLGNT